MRIKLNPGKIHLIKFSQKKLFNDTSITVYGQPLKVTQSVPLDETHLDAVRWLIQLRDFNKCINKKSSSERYYYVRVEQTDLLYANPKNLIQSGRIWIRVASLSLVSFCHLSVLDQGQLIYYVNVYHLSLEQYIISFSIQFVSCWSFIFGEEYDIFRNGDKGAWKKHLI